MKELKVFLATILIASVGYFGYTQFTQPEPVQKTQIVQPAQSETHPPTAEELLSLVNAERAKVGVAPLTIDPRLNASAQRKAVDMDTNNYFDHVSPVDGRHGYEYITDTGIYCRADGENITDNIYRNDAESAIHAFVVSKPHFEAMTNPRNTLTGFGISGTKIVEHFCEV